MAIAAPLGQAGRPQACNSGVELIDAGPVKLFLALLWPCLLSSGWGPVPRESAFSLSQQALVGGDRNPPEAAPQMKEWVSTLRLRPCPTLALETEEPPCPGANPEASSPATQHPAPRWRQPGMWLSRAVSWNKPQPFQFVLGLGVLLRLAKHFSRDWVVQSLWHQAVAKGPMLGDTALRFAAAAPGPTPCFLDLSSPSRPPPPVLHAASDIEVSWGPL